MNHTPRLVVADCDDRPCTELKGRVAAFYAAPAQNGVATLAFGQCG
jgi:hypothetical protein